MEFIIYLSGENPAFKGTIIIAAYTKASNSHLLSVRMLCYVVLIDLSMTMMSFLVRT
jgi:hypothetical protein